MCVCLDCILELRKALLAFDPVAPVKAALHLKEFKVLMISSYTQNYIISNHSNPVEKSDRPEHARVCFVVGDSLCL